MAYATVSQVKQYLGIDAANTADDALLGRLIDAAQAAINRFCGRQFESVTASRQRDMAHWRGRYLMLDDDLRALTSVTTSAGDSWTATDFYVYSTPTRFIVAKEGVAPSPQAMFFTVTGQWGWTTSAPDDIVQATIRLASYFYRQKDAQVLDTAGMPPMANQTIPTRIPQDVVDLIAGYSAKAIDAW